MDSIDSKLLSDLTSDVLILLRACGIPAAAYSGASGSAGASTVDALVAGCYEAAVGARQLRAQLSDDPNGPPPPRRAISDPEQFRQLWTQLHDPTQTASGSVAARNDLFLQLTGFILDDRSLTQLVSNPVPASAAAAASRATTTTGAGTSTYTSQYSSSTYASRSTTTATSAGASGASASAGAGTASSRLSSIGTANNSLPSAASASSTAGAGAGARSNYPPYSSAPAASAVSTGSSYSRSTTAYGAGSADTKYGAGSSSGSSGSTASTAAAPKPAMDYSGLLSPASAKQLHSIRAKPSAGSSTGSTAAAAPSTSGSVSTAGHQLLRRSALDRDLADLTFGTAVYLRSHNSMFVNVSSAEAGGPIAPSTTATPAPASATAATPTVSVTAHPGTATGEHGLGLGGGMSALTILNANSLSDRSNVQFQDSVAFSVGSGAYFLSADGNGRIVAVSKPDSKCKFTLLSASQQATGSASGRSAGGKTDAGPTANREFASLLELENFGVVKVCDQIILKSWYGSYFTLSGDNSLIPNGVGPQIWRLTASSLPVTPDWSVNRFFVLNEHTGGGDGFAASKESTLAAAQVLNSVGSAPASGSATASASSNNTEVQEQLLVQDLLYAMLGIDGKWIYSAPAAAGAAAGAGVAGGGGYQINPQISDASLLDVLKRMIPICDYYAVVNQHVTVHNRFEYGLVNHAFCSAIRVLLKEYLLLIAQLESQANKRALTLLRAWFYIQPSLHTMERLYRLCVKCGSATGGSLLNVIHSAFVQEGDGQGRALYAHLLAHASGPYFEMLEQWIYGGLVRDPYSEFQIHSNPDLSTDTLVHDFTDTYWEHRYSVRTSKLPTFLERVSEKILTTGKYLNVIRECGQSITAAPTAAASAASAPVSTESGATDAADTKLATASSSGDNKQLTTAAVAAALTSARPVPVQHRQQLRYTTNEKEYVDVIERAYAFASARLLDLLLKEKRLMARFRSVKRYFLFEAGDVVESFLDRVAGVAGASGDSGTGELHKLVQDIQPTKLEAALEASIRSSRAGANDPFKDDLVASIKMHSFVQRVEAMHATSKDLKDGKAPAAALSAASAGGSAGPAAALKGLDAFTLDYRVAWPLSLVLSRRALTKYQLLFQHLFKCKHVDRVLSRSWICHQASKELGVARAFSSAYALRQKMLHFLQNFQYYMMVEVIEPNWSAMEQKMKHVTTVDEVLSWHTDFLDRCIKNCLIGNHNLIKILTRLLDTCVAFGEYIERFTASTQRSASEEEANANDARFRGRSNPLARRYARIESDTARLQTAARSTAYVSRISQLQTAFDEQLGLLLSALTNKTLLLDAQSVQNLFTRLDFNGFYTQTIQQQQSQQPPTLVTASSGAASGVAVAPSPSHAAQAVAAASGAVGGRRAEAF